MPNALPKHPYLHLSLLRYGGVDLLCVFACCRVEVVVWCVKILSHVYNIPQWSWLEMADYIGSCPDGTKGDYW
jgi:hypothetical protein